MTLELQPHLLTAAKNAEDDHPFLEDLRARNGEFLDYNQHFSREFIGTLTPQKAPYVAYRALERFEKKIRTDNDPDYNDGNLLFMHRIAEKKKPIASVQLQNGIGAILCQIEENKDSPYQIYRGELAMVANDAVEEGAGFFKDTLVNFYHRHSYDTLVAREAPALAEKHPETAPALYNSLRSNLNMDHFPKFIYALAAVGHTAEQPQFVDDVMNKSLVLLSSQGDDKDDYICHQTLVQFSMLSEKHADLFTPPRLEILTNLAVQALDRTQAPKQDNDAIDLLGSYAQLWADLLRTKRDYFDTPEKMTAIGEFALRACDATDRSTEKNEHWTGCIASTGHLISAILGVQRQHDFVM
jgi:hypothetical protein